MDKTAKIEEIQQYLKKSKEENVKKFEEATGKLQVFLKKYPDLKEDKNLQYMIVYAYLHVGDKINTYIDDAFKTYSGSLSFLNDKIKRDSKSTMMYLFTALENLVMKADRSHNVYVLSKKDPRIVMVLNKTTGEKEEKNVLNLLMWVDDIKSIANISVWENDILMYSTIKENMAYKMQLVFNGQTFFPAKDPMIQELPGFSPDWAEMIKFIVTAYQEMKEPFSALENTRGKLFYIIGKIIKDANGGIFLSPVEATTSILSLLRTPETRQYDDGDDVIILGNIQKSKPFTGRDGKLVQPNSDYTVFSSAVMRLSPKPEEQKTVVTTTNNDSSDSLNEDDLGL